MISIPQKFKVRPIFPFNDVEFYPGELFLPITDRVVPQVYNYYSISIYGRVWHNYLGKFISPGVNGAGYLFFMASTELGPKPVQIHRAVMITFNYIENADLYEVNHKDGNKLNPFIGNLEWTTHKENVDHAYRTGLQKSGEEHWNASITNEQAVQICNLLQTGAQLKEIADIVGCSVTVVAAIKKKEAWTSVSQNYNFDSRPGRLFDENMIRNLCIYFENNPKGNLTVNDHGRNALRYYGYPDDDRYVDTVRKLYNRKYYTKISCEYKF